MDDFVADGVSPPMGVSGMAKTVQRFDSKERELFVALFSQKTENVSDLGVKYIQLPNAGNEHQTDKIILRPCYAHMTPHILHQLSLKDKSKVTVTGTPGIGKTMYGLVLLRKFVAQKKGSVVYWAGDEVYLFSWDTEVTRRFGIFSLGKAGELVLSAGRWNTENIDFWDVMREPNTIVVHDPKADDLRVAINISKFDQLVLILSYGHKLINHWETKTNPIHLTLFQPLWTLDEGTKASNLLHFKTGVTNEDLFYKYGGCIRGWLQMQNMEKSLLSKVTDVVKKNGTGLLERTQDARGSIVHVQVEFDASKRIPTLRQLQAIANESRASDDELAAMADLTLGDPSELNHFTESSTEYVFGSQFILEKIDQTIMTEGEEALKLCMQTWTAQPGYESIYGGLFELRCHRRFVEIGRGALELRAKQVFRDGTETKDFLIRLPELRRVLRHSGNDPSILKNSTFQSYMELQSYFWPRSSNFPSYDAATIVEGGVLGLKKQNHPIALLLQMTVSGATGLPRRPSHEVKQHIRKKFDAVFKEKVQNYQGAITAFVVPTECFDQFQFQSETVMKGEDIVVKEVRQPAWQLVIEMPDLFVLSKQTKEFLELPEVKADNKRKRKHRYSSQPTQKRQRAQK